MRETAINAVNLSEGSHGMLPNQCPTIWKTEGQASQANKQGGVHKYYDKPMTVSITTASNNQLDWITDGLCRSTEKKSAGKDLRGQAS